MADLATAAELSAFLKIPVDEGQAALALAGVSGLVRGHTGRRFEHVADEVARVDGTGSRSLLLPRLPVVGVSSIVEDPDGSGVELAVGTAVDWSFDGILRRVDGGVFVGRLRFYEITYSHGDVTADELAAVKLLVLRICARAVVNPEGATQENVAGYGQTFGFDTTRLATLSPADRLELAPFLVTV